MNNLAIVARAISKKYKLYDSPIDRLKDSFSLSKTTKYSKEFHALNDINFEIKKGESVGIIGKNGSGKSTLLKIITGVLNPTSGEIKVEGHISAILELGAGFNPEYTGMQNIFLSGTIMGYSREQMEKKVPEIVEFADIGEFIHQPVKNYSSGMYVRLAFSVAISVDPEVLIIDEALSVGDIRFQQKCLRKIEELKKEKTILFVSHDLLQLSKFCDRLIWINEGHLIADGDPEDISKKYQAFMAGSTLNDYTEFIEAEDEALDLEIDPIDSSVQVFGDNKAKIKGISMFNEKQMKIYQTKTGNKIMISIQVSYQEVIDSPIIGFTIKDRIGNIVTQTNTFILKQKMRNTQINKVYRYNFEFIVPSLKRGTYTVSPAVASGNQVEHTQHCWIHDALIIKIDDQQEYDLEGFMVLDNVSFDAK
ncbi:ABC transporter ATP-binding protein [Lysinibacillus sp. CNPSo 3705]|uniref:ABC transporter ATP-binding protein n=1 Tax=Lysinibacillus sp. CNPSo 3705 TaxID=3028148 RepID=UPI0023634F02|nr:ABC transporter ATP-binding protein [Lysinibacillus sp. CNPSo 3705]MDD1505869.1 ABC transporter ATP-binding protein [Lysinibacillus sp. CNPSo 3705]